MAKKKRLEDYVSEMKKVREYKEKIEEIRKKHKIDKMEEYIKEHGSFVEDENFLMEFGCYLRNMYLRAISTDMLDEFQEIIYSFATDVSDISFNFEKIKKDEDEFYYYRVEEINYIQEVYDTVTFPCSINFFELYEKLEEFDQACTENFERIKKEEEEAERIRKEKEAKEEYELYLRLKAKYETEES